MDENYRMTDICGWLFWHIYIVLWTTPDMLHSASASCLFFLPPFCTEVSPEPYTL
jgi:hypothetical protein